MIVHCPKCKNPIGEGLGSCPECRAVFTSAETEVMEREKQERMKSVNAEQKKMIEDFRKKRKVFAIVMLILVILVPASVFGVWTLTGNIEAGFIALAVMFVIMIGTIAAGIVTGAARCPYCDAILFRQYGTHCHSCGKRLD